MIYDVITYNGEADLLEIRLNLLKDYVDQFIIVESRYTFSGKVKPLYFLRETDRYKNFPIKFFQINEWDDELRELAKSSPNTKGMGSYHWEREFFQKESIKKALVHLQDDDIVFIGDCDEIWDPSALTLKGVQKLKLRVYSYYLNNRSDEEFWGPIVGKYKNIKNEVLNHLRTKAQKTKEYHGWHFTNMGGLEQVRRKLNDSYTAESYNTPEIQNKLEERFGKSDYIGRNFTFTIDDSELPMIDRVKYSHLFRQPLVSIVIPLYNYGRYLGETIQSALNQTYKNIEIICVDDCSSDDSVEVASKYPVRVIKHEKNKGLAETRNTGIRAARGEYILPLDSDDWLHKDFIKYTLALNTDIASTGQRQFGEKNFVYIPMLAPTFEDFKRGNQINCCSLYKKEVWEKVGGYKSGKIFEDWYFWLEATYAGFKVKTVQYPLFFYRIHKGSMLDKIKRDHREIGREMIAEIEKR
jgi:hypothetical protein